MNHRRSQYVHNVAIEIQAAAGAAPYATLDELIDIFLAVADRIPPPLTAADGVILRRLLARTTGRMYRAAGATRLRAAVDAVAEADDPRQEFRQALAALRTPAPPGAGTQA